MPATRKCPRDAYLACVEQDKRLFYAQFYSEVRDLVGGRRLYSSLTPIDLAGESLK